MDKGVIIILIIVALGIIYLKTSFNQRRKNNLIKKYGDTLGNAIDDKKLVIGMSSEMASEIKGLPVKSDGKIIRENYTKEVVYYDEYKDVHQKPHYRFKVTFENDKITEIRDFN